MLIKSIVYRGKWFGNLFLYFFCTSFACILRLNQWRPCTTFFLRTMEIAKWVNINTLYEIMKWNMILILVNFILHFEEIVKRIIFALFIQMWPVWLKQYLNKRLCTVTLGKKCTKTYSKRPPNHFTLQTMLKIKLNFTFFLGHHGITK